MDPEDYPDKRDALISDFRAYLGILRAVHSGDDLNGAAEAAGASLSGETKARVGYVLHHQGDRAILPLIENAMAARADLAPSISGNRCGPM